MPLERNEKANDADCQENSRKQIGWDLAALCDADFRDCAAPLKIQSKTRMAASAIETSAENKHGNRCRRKSDIAIRPTKTRVAAGDVAKKKRALSTCEPGP